MTRTITMFFFCSIPSLFFLIEFKTADLQPTTFEFKKFNVIITPRDAMRPTPPCRQPPISLFARRLPHIWQFCY